MNMTEKIRELCKRKEISMTELEKELGFGNGSLTKGDNENIKLNRLRKIARYFNVNLYYFFNEDELEDLEVKEHFESNVINYMMGTDIFVDFCDQYRKKDGCDIMELFGDFAKNDERYSRYEEEYYSMQERFNEAIEE